MSGSTRLESVVATEPKASAADRISIIIPAYQARNFLSEALESVLRQTHRNWEVLIIDDASPESVDDLVARLSTAAPAGSVRLLKHEVNSGVGAARNTGILAASGDYVAFLDHDDVWLPNHLETLLDELKARNVDLAFCGVEMFNDERGDLGPWTPTEAELKDMARAMFVRCFLAPSATLVKKEALIKVGLFDPSPAMRYVDDFDIYLRLVLGGFTFAYVPRRSCRYRQHPGSATKRQGLMEMGLASVRYKYMGVVDWPQMRKRRIVASGYLYAAKNLWQGGRKLRSIQALLTGSAVLFWLKW